jgi:hypothetical protein
VKAYEHGFTSAETGRTISDAALPTLKIGAVGQEQTVAAASQFSS